MGILGGCGVCRCRAVSADRFLANSRGCGRLRFHSIIERNLDLVLSELSVVFVKVLEETFTLVELR